MNYLSLDLQSLNGTELNELEHMDLDKCLNLRLNFESQAVGTK